MVIERWTGPPVETHTYLVIDEPSGEAWAIDAPLETAAPVLERVRERGLRLTRVVLTHGHFDHLLDLERYHEAGVPLAANPLDRALFQARQTDYFGLPYRMPRVRIDEEIGEGTRLRLGEDEWDVWHVPGHAPGHVLLYCAARETVLGGDMLFRAGYGRVDLPGADPAAMAASLLRLLELPPQTRVYPGHGPETTLAAERRWLEPLLSNPAGVRL
jgi:hydroxyacylglutathione hydrolase